MRKFKSGEIFAEQGSSLLLEGHGTPHLYTLLSGWAFRHKSLEDGRRQILSFALPGDFLGVQGALLEAMSYSVEALTPVRLCMFPRERLWDLYKAHPALAHDILTMTSRSEYIADVHLLSVGQRTATERVAYILLHLHNRAAALGLVQGGRLKLPLTQLHLADALGLSLVHTNKTLRRLGSDGLIRWGNQTLELLDVAELRRMAKFDEDDKVMRPFI